MAKRAKPKRGRPTKYKRKTGEEICRLLAAGLSLRRICRENPHLPAESTIRTWAVENTQGFFALYARAKEFGTHSIVEETIDIADDDSNDWIETEDGPRLNHEHVQRSRLRVDTRKWLAGKILPRLYGDRIQVDAGTDDGLLKELTDALKNSPTE